MSLDDPNDPALSRIHADRLIRRDIDQLLGICEFSLQDGVIDQAEATAILTWLNNHRACLDSWPANVLYDRLQAMLSDGVIDADEEGELLGLLMSFARPRLPDEPAIATALPIDAPAPAIVIPERTFCFTGVFDFGTRAECQGAIAERGGVTAAGVTRKLNYLVIGNVGSDYWKHSTFGNKIAKAVEYRDNGVPLAIVSEAHWVTCLT